MVEISQTDEHFLSGENVKCRILDENGPGFYDCKWKAIENWLGCGLPWVTNSNSESLHIHITVFISNLAYLNFTVSIACNTKDHFGQFMDLHQNQSLLEEQLTKAKCKPLPCKESSWKFNVVFQGYNFSNPKIETFLRMLEHESKESEMILQLNMKSLWVETIKHVPMYGFNNFIADFGGYLGLLLGGSLLAIFDEIVLILNYLTK